MADKMLYNALSHAAQTGTPTIFVLEALGSLPNQHIYQEYI